MELPSTKAEFLTKSPGKERVPGPNADAGALPPSFRGASKETNNRCIPKNSWFTSCVTRRNSLSGSNPLVQLSCTTNWCNPRGISAVARRARLTTHVRRRTTICPRRTNPSASDAAGDYSRRRRERRGVARTCRRCGPAITSARTRPHVGRSENDAMAMGWGARPMRRTGHPANLEAEGATRATRARTGPRGMKRGTPHQNSGPPCRLLAAGGLVPQAL